MTSKRSTYPWLPDTLGKGESNAIRRLRYFMMEDGLSPEKSTFKGKYLTF